MFATDIWLLFWPILREDPEEETQDDLWDTEIEG